MRCDDYDEGDNGQHDEPCDASDIVAKLEDLVIGLLFTSESDYPITVFQVPVLGNDLTVDNAIDTLLSIRSIVNTDHRQYWIESCTATREVSLDWFFARYINVEDWWEPAQHSILPQWTNLQSLVIKYLSNIKVYRIGQATDHELMGSIDVFVVGRCKSDDKTFVGLHTISVET